ncbi:MAG: hypothetical protein ACREN6_04090 [Gemmatimonadaceae bacterium]
MNSIFSGPQFAYLIIAFIVLGFAFAGIVWVGRTIRGELGAGSARGGSGGGLTMLEQIPPAMMKEAIARGLVVPSQLAGMTEMERTFLFASLKQKLAAAAAAAANDAPISAAAAPVPAPAPVAAPVAAPALAPKPVTPALPADIPPAMLAILSAEKLRVWCPMCGTELHLPTFPPLLARCEKCGMKSAVRAEEGGRYVLNVSPPPNTRGERGAGS